MTRSRHIQRLGLVLLVAASNIFCVMDRGASRWTLSGSGEYAFAGDRSYGCDGEVLHEERHHQTGGSASIRYEQRYGFNAQILGSLFQGDPVGSGETYWMGSLGALVGWDFQYVGFDLGASFLRPEESSIENSDQNVFPFFKLRAGKLDQIWGELGVGPLVGPYDGRMIYTGVAGKADNWSYQAGFAMLARPLISDEWGDLTMGTMNDGPDFGLYGSIQLPIAAGFALNLAGILAESPSARLGLSYSF